MKHESKIPTPYLLLRSLGGMDRKIFLHMKREK